VNQRRDARRNRARIVAAAAEVFREAGAFAPLDLVARRADVGRGTLYRHFPDRDALVAAVLEMRMTALEDYAATYAGDDLVEHLLVEICALQLDAPGLMTLVRDPAAPPQRLEDLARRTTRLMAGALATAQRAGVVRDDVTLVDVFLTVAMMDGVITARAATPDLAPVDRALDLVLRALRPPERLGLPTPEPALRLPGPGDLDATG